MTQMARLGNSMPCCLRPAGRGISMVKRYSSSKIQACSNFRAANTGTLNARWCSLNIHLVYKCASSRAAIALLRSTGLKYSRDLITCISKFSSMRLELLRQSGYFSSIQYMKLRRSFRAMSRHRRATKGLALERAWSKSSSVRHLLAVPEIS